MSRHHVTARQLIRASNLRSALFVGVSVLLAFGTGIPSLADTPSSEKEDAREGLRLLLEKPFVTSAFNDEEFDETWKVWPEPSRSKAEIASRSERRRMAFERYGLTRRPDSDEWNPMQYVVDRSGNWHQNCLSCHGGRVNGQPYPGAPNRRFALAALTEDVIKVRIRRGTGLRPSDLGSFVVPLGSTNGTTNAVMFGVLLMGRRDNDLNLAATQATHVVHHDMDAPPWWNYKTRTQLYSDGFAEKSHRALMPFLLEPTNGPERFKEWESDFRKIEQFLESVPSPRYPHEIDSDLADAGRVAFDRVCSECHGSYGEKPSYPELTISLNQVGTDPVRLGALNSEYRVRYGKSWFGFYGQSEVLAEPDGYVAPPLNGIWASAPYLHNGSVPTLWHLLHPGDRPQQWQASRDRDFDDVRIGIAIEPSPPNADQISDPLRKRDLFDTTQFGKSAAGHDYPDRLTADEKRAVLEYLKTL